MNINNVFVIENFSVVLRHIHMKKVILLTWFV